MRVTWIGGWGVAPETLRPLAERFLPEATHVFQAPTSRAPETAVESDLIIAWSLGAWRLLNAASQGLVVSQPALLLAPFVAFCSNFGLGGRCAQSQVRWLSRWLQRRPVQALTDFYQRAGLGQPPMNLPYGATDLQEGLDRLAEAPSPALQQFAARGLPAGWFASIGDRDPLLDANSVGHSLAGCQIVPGAGHAPEPLLAAALARWKEQANAL
jgi:hypothetical protein